MWKVVEKTVKEVAVETLCPGVDTHRSPSSALFSKSGGTRGGCVLFGRCDANLGVSLLSSVVMHLELELRTPVYKLEFC